MTTTRLAAGFHHIGIVGRLESDSVEQSVQLLLKILQHRHKQYAVEHRLASALPTINCPSFDRTSMGQWADLLIVVGGDGTFLGAARDFADYEVPMLGVNRGRLGFLTDIMPDAMEQGIGEVLDGNFRLEERFLLRAEVHRQGRQLSAASAFNDVVLHPRQSIRMIEFNLYIDDQFVYNQKSDGLIVATPTGSTAYALSAGGPLLHPSMDALVLVPMFPHSLNNRPIVVGAKSRICIRMGQQNQQPPQVSLDAQNQLELEHGDELHIDKYPHALHLIHLHGYNYFETCRSKLGWGNRIDGSEESSA